MRDTKGMMHLECVLTADELLGYSRKLSENITKKTRAEESMKSFAAQKKAEIASCDAEIGLMADKVNTGKEYRSVECVIEYDFEKREKRWTRTDTKEVCRNERITEEECQEEIVLKAEAGASADCAGAVEGATEPATEVKQ